MSEPLDESPRLSCPLLYRDLSRIVFRDWAAILSPPELAIVMMVFDRTIGWGKEAEYIPHRHFLDGVYGDDGKCYNRGLNISRRSLIMMLKTLRDDGFLSATVGRSGENKYAIIFSRKPKPLDMFRVPKRAKDDTANADAPPVRVSSFRAPKPRQIPPDRGVQILHGGVQKTSLGGANSAPIREEIKERESKEASPLIGPSGPMRIVSEIQSRGKERKASTLAQAVASVNPTIAQLELIHRTAWEDKHPGTPYLAPKQKEWLAVKGYCKRYSVNAHVPFGTMFQWCCENWGMVVNSVFSWMTENPPGEFPNVMFILRRSGDFEQAYRERAKLLAQANRPLRQRLIDQLTDKGMDHELAEKEVDERLAKASPVPRTVAPQVDRNARFLQQAAKPIVVPVAQAREVSSYDWDSFKL